MNKGYILLLAPRPAGRSPKGRGGGRASAALPLPDEGTASTASRRLESARPALGPKGTLDSSTDLTGCQLFLEKLLPVKIRVHALHRHKRVVRATLDNRSLFQHHNLVSALNR